MQISKHVHALKHIFYVPISPEITLERFVYSYVLFGKKNIYLVDSGLKDSFYSIYKCVTDNGRKISEISKLILTHSHPDHIGSAKEIKDTTSCEILAHVNEKSWIEDIDKQFTDRPVPGFKNFVSKSVEVDTLLNDGEILNLEDELKISIIHTPGHSKGSISLFFENENILFCGDTLLLPGDLPIYENVTDAVNSIKKLRNIINIKILLSAWDHPTEGESIYDKMNKSISYFKILHEAVRGIENASQLSSMELCKSVIDKLGMPPAAVNPLVAKSFLSNLTLNNMDIFN